MRKVGRSNPSQTNLNHEDQFIPQTLGNRLDCHNVLKNDCKKKTGLLQRTLTAQWLWAKNRSKFRAVYKQCWKFSRLMENKQTIYTFCLAYFPCGGGHIATHSNHLSFFSFYGGGWVLTWPSTCRCQRLICIIHFKIVYSFLQCIYD